MRGGKLLAGSVNFGVRKCNPFIFFAQLGTESEMLTHESVFRVEDVGLMLQLNPIIFFPAFETLGEWFRYGVGALSRI